MINFVFGITYISSNTRYQSWRLILSIADSNGFIVCKNMQVLQVYKKGKFLAVLAVYKKEIL